MNLYYVIVLTCPFSHNWATQLSVPDNVFPLINILQYWSHNKHNKFTQYWADAGPPSLMLDQHWSNIGSTFCVDVNHTWWWPTTLNIAQTSDQEAHRGQQRSTVACRDKPNLKSMSWLNYQQTRTVEPNAGSMLAQCRWRWPNIKQALDKPIFQDNLPQTTCILWRLVVLFFTPRETGWWIISLKLERKCIFFQLWSCVQFTHCLLVEFNNVKNSYGQQ